LIPEDLVKSIEDILKCSLARFDTDTRMLGRPFWWQGEEDAVWPDDDGSYDNKDSSILVFFK
jgi:phage-related protein